jgi:antitoxin component YwqK of YwqJK toxin-antitoxin module
MNKYFTLYLFSLICFTTCNGQRYSTAIALVEEINDKGEIQGKTDTGWVEYLDESGNILKKVITNNREYGGVIKTTLYSARGVILSKIVDFRNGHIDRTDFIRDTNNFLIAFKGYELDSKDTVWTYFKNNYDSNSRYLFSRMIDSRDSSISVRSKSRFDQNRKIVEDAELDSANHEISKNLYEYTNSGKLLKQTYYENGVQISFTEYKYVDQRKIESILTPAAKERKQIRVRFIYQ